MMLFVIAWLWLEGVSDIKRIFLFGLRVINDYIIKMKAQTLDDYTRLSVIGKGTYAKVLLVRSKEDKLVYAMKVLKKKYILEKNQEKNIMT